MPTAWSGTDRVCTAREFGIPNVQMQSSPKGGPCAEYLAHVRAILLGWEVLNQGSQAIVRERQRSLGGRRVLVAKPFCMPNQISRCWIVPVAQSADIDLARRPACSPRAQCSACLILAAGFCCPPARLSAAFGLGARQPANPRLTHGRAADPGPVPQIQKGRRPTFHPAILLAHPCKSMAI